ncbi:MAG: thioredoxin family protein [Gemmatimonadales bacterium]
MTDLRRTMVSLGAAALLLTPTLAGQATAQVKEDFTQERFEALQAEGALILLDVFADWCPTCAEQQRVLAAYREARPSVPLHTLVIDYDRQRRIARRFGAPRQSTLILFDGTTRRWFAVAEVRRDVIFAALDEAAAARRASAGSR